MLKAIEKLSVKHLAMLACVVMLFGAFLPLTAAAETSEGIFRPLGASEITEAEAMFAVSEFLDIPADQLDEMFLFVEVPEDNCVEVYARETNELSELVYKDEDGNYHGYVSGFTIAFDGDGINNIVGTVAAGVGGVFDMSASGFKFITDSDICMIMLSVTFAGAGIGLVARALKTSRK